MRHSKVEPGSPALKAKVGVVLFDGSAGPVSIVVAGAVRAGAGAPAAAVDPALERRARLARAEGERGRRVAGRIRGPGVDRVLGRIQVYGPGLAGRCCVGVAGGVAGAHVEGVTALAER